MSISELPNEIHDKIFTYVAQDEDDLQDPIWSLASISRTSSRFHHSAEPLLYLTFEEFNERSLLKYLGTILECPHLAAHVRQYQGWHKPKTFTKYSVNNLFFSGWNVQKTFLRSILHGIASDDREAQDWVEAIEEGSWDATTALALAHLPNLQHLHLAIIGIHRPISIFQVDHQVGNYYWVRETLMRAAQLQHQGISSPLSLEHMTTLTLVPNREGSRELSASQLLPLLKLKSMRKLVARGWDLRWGIIDRVDTTIIELELLNFNLKETFFTPFFECFPALEKLHCEHLHEGDISPSQLIMMSLAHTLIQLRPPLRELHVKNGSGCGDRDNLGDMSMIKSFSGFENLEVIDILAYDQWIRWVFVDHGKHQLAPLVALLPGSIKRLALRNASTWTIEHVMGLLQHKDRVPNLKLLVIGFVRWFHLNEAAGELGLLLETGSRCGIEILVEGGIIMCPDTVEVDYDPYPL
ncbi:uncharacterized protein K444DRAFT_609272 [Hyaloscypha bicolor E]|uniref:Leucine-rich repeat domain-containing protein n=1 Tax=Hyaloscypha bicolor E TaxID=1095630 RepID=A0A2J6TMA0_9HELO|nr:uncharacterized protein K444DRAFT_609272 [Hyaloscypha bicolor E]PMD64146.1 hypothetical protein K444DRAFT_609272 [Hyaloscypha bicolor E]